MKRPKARDGLLTFLIPVALPEAAPIAATYKVKKTGESLSKKSETKKPWNAFPMASLSVRGVSACAADVLRYLAIRSNYLGETVVGHRRMCDDMRRSKDYVTRGLKELEARKLVTGAQRNRHKNQADRRIISIEIVPEEWRHRESSPEDQEHTGSNPDLSNPEEQDWTSKSSPDFPKSSPDRQGKTLQNEPTGLKPNLTEQNQSKKESKQVASPSLVASLSSDQTEESDPDTEEELPDSEEAGASPLAVAHPNSPASQESKPPAEDDHMLYLYGLLYDGSSNLHTDAQRSAEMVVIRQILDKLEDAGWTPADHPCWWPYVELVKWNRAHYAPGACKQKYEGLFIHNAKQMLKALPTLLDNWATHEFRTCYICRKAELRSPAQLREHQREYEEAWEEARRKRAEEERKKAEEARQAESRRMQDQFRELCGFWASDVSKHTTEKSAVRSALLGVLESGRAVSKEEFAAILGVDLSLLNQVQARVRVGRNAPAVPSTDARILQTVPQQDCSCLR